MRCYTHSHVLFSWASCLIVIMQSGKSYSHSSQKPQEEASWYNLSLRVFVAFFFFYLASVSCLSCWRLILQRMPQKPRKDAYSLSQIGHPEDGKHTLNDVSWSVWCLCLTWNRKENFVLMRESSHSDLVPPQHTRVPVWELTGDFGDPLSLPPSLSQMFHLYRRTSHRTNLTEVVLFLPFLKESALPDGKEYSSLTYFSSFLRK